MTFDEFRRDWQRLTVLPLDPPHPQVPEAVRLADVIMFVYGGTMRGGMLCDSGGQQGNPAWILKPDEQDGCWVKVDWDTPDDEGWELIGRFQLDSQGLTTE